MNHGAEIAALKRRIAALEAKIDPPAREPIPFQLGPARNGRGEVVLAPDAEQRRERQIAEDRENEERRKRAEDAERKAFGGAFKDHLGMWRSSDGRRVPAAEAAALEARSAALARGETVPPAATADAFQRMPGGVREIIDAQFADEGYTPSRRRK
jgi:hypothetical protein